MILSKKNDELLLVEKNICWNCNFEIIEYYSKNDKEKRGRCPRCGIDFTLEGGSLSKLNDIRFKDQTPPYD